MVKNSNKSALAILRQILTPTFISIFLITFLSVGAYYLTFVIMVQYSTEKFSVESSTAGLITGVVIVGALIGRFFSGEFVVRYGFLKPLAWSVALHAFFNFLYLFANSPVTLFLNRVAVGLALGAVSSIANAMAAAIAPRNHQATTIAYFSMSTALAVCIGPFLALSLTKALGYNGLFWLCIAMSTSCLFLLIFIRMPDKEVHNAARKLSFKDCIEPSVIPFCLILALTSMAWASMPAFLSPYSLTDHVEFGASIFFVVYAIAMIVTRPFTGTVCDRHGPRGVLVTSMTSLALGLGLLWIGENNFLVILAGILTGFGFGNILSVGQAATVSMVHRAQYTQATSTFYIVLDIGSGISPYIFGSLLPLLGYNGIFGASAIVVILAMPLYLTLIHHRKPA